MHVSKHPMGHGLKFGLRNQTCPEYWSVYILPSNSSRYYHWDALKFTMVLHHSRGSEIQNMHIQDVQSLCWFRDLIWRTTCCSSKQLTKPQIPASFTLKKWLTLTHRRVSGLHPFIMDDEPVTLETCVSSPAHRKRSYKYACSSTWLTLC